MSPTTASPTGRVCAVPEAAGDALLARVRLKDVIYYEVHGRRREKVEEQTEFQHDGELLHRYGRDMLEVRQRVSVTAPDADYVVDVAAIFVVRDQGDLLDENLDEDALDDFTVRHAAYILHPYLRQAFHELSVRLRRTRLMLDVLQPGELELETYE